MSDSPAPQAPKVVAVGYPKKAFALALDEDRQHVLLVELSVPHPGAQPEQVGVPLDLTQGFYATLLSLCPPGETTPVYGGGKHVMDVRIDLIPEELRTPVPQEHLDVVPEFRAPERKPLDLSKPQLLE